MVNVPPEVVFSSIVESARSDVFGSDFDSYLAEAVGALPAATESPNLQHPVDRLLPVGRDIEARFGPSALPRFGACLVAALGIEQRRPSGPPLPQSVEALYPGTIERLARHLTGGSLEAYWIGSDDFLKDLRFVGGYSVPCGTVSADVYGEISRRSGIKSAVRYGDLKNGFKIAMHGGPPWFDIHADSRHLEEFTPQGWLASYRRIADLLNSRPDVKGLVGTSWFYDPAVLHISPRLSYLHEVPLANGASLVKHGHSDEDARRATATSATRRSAVDRGSYHPRSYSMVWPREALTQWARRHGPR